MVCPDGQVWKDLDALKSSLELKAHPSQPRMIATVHSILAVFGTLPEGRAKSEDFLVHPQLYFIFKGGRGDKKFTHFVPASSAFTDVNCARR